MRILVTVSAAVASGLITALLCVVAGLFHVAVQMRHLTPPITGTDAAYGVVMFAYAGIGLIIASPLGLFVYFKIDDCVRGAPSGQRPARSFVGSAGEDDEAAN